MAVTHAATYVPTRSSTGSFCSPLFTHFWSGGFHLDRLPPHTHRYLHKPCVPPSIIGGILKFCSCSYSRLISRAMSSGIADGVCSSPARTSSIETARFCPVSRRTAMARQEYRWLYVMSPDDDGEAESISDVLSATAASLSVDLFHADEIHTGREAPSSFRSTVINSSVVRICG